jgi:hypothetical protein
VNSKVITECNHVQGKELRDTLDACMEKNMWFFSIGALLLLLLLPPVQLVFVIVFWADLSPVEQCDL